MRRKSLDSILSIDDRIHSSTVVYYDIFYFGEKFIHKQLTDKQSRVEIKKQVFTYADGEVNYHQEMKKSHSKFRIIPHEKIRTIATSKPKKDFLISSSHTSAISLETDAIISVAVDKISGQYRLMIYSSKDAIYYNRCMVDKGTFPFHSGDQLVVAGVIIEVREQQLKLTSLENQFFLNPWEIVEEAYLTEYPVDFPTFRRSPRIHLKEPKQKIDIVEPKLEKKERENEWLKMIIPSVAMVVLSGATSFISGGNPMVMISMGSVSLLTAGCTVASYFTNKKEAKHKNEQRINQYEQYLIQEKSILNTLQQEQKKALEYMNPSIDELSLMTKEYHSRIYERMMTHEDFLNVSLGKGSVPSSFTTHYQLLEENELSQQVKEQLIRPYGSLEQAPIVVSLKDQILGFSGTTASLRTAIQTLLFQLAVLHSYHDVEFILLLSEEDYEKYWHSWRWLPHIKNQNLNLRGIVHNQQTKEMVLNSFYQIIVKRRQQVREAVNGRPQFRPHYILSILDESWLLGHGLNEFLAEDISSYGVTVIWGKNSVNSLPETTTVLVDYHSKEAAVLINQNKEYVNQRFISNPLPTTYPMEQAIRRLANLHHLEIEKNIIPEHLSFLEQYEVDRMEELEIEKRWINAEPNRSIRSLIGWRGKSDPVYWDLHERVHGPHALVAGTTGSGKSEFLTNYLIGLAINFSPEDIGMLIIDWKGGGIANTVDRLPHFMGAITNLDNTEIARVLISIKAELSKRQREFAKYHVNNIYGYMNLYKQRKNPKPTILYPTKALPQLFLVVDEFAELKVNVPEFLDELTSVARIGRSLGVHLILATQKPAGVVNDQIEANSTSKIALKMASVQDSNELLKTADAAQIKNPGRGYLKVGENEVYELFQSGYTGIIYEPNQVMEETIDERIYRINGLGQADLLYDPDEYRTINTDRDLPTQLEAVIEKINDTFVKSDFTIPDKPWLPKLEKRIITPTPIKTQNRCLKIPLGLLDIPSDQIQTVYEFDLEKAKHTAIFASSGYGKSTIIQTMTINLSCKNTPEQIHFHLLDFGNNGLSPLKDLPHVVDIVNLEDEKLQKMIDRIVALLLERKNLFKQAEVLNLSQYEIKTKIKLPINITIVDGYDGLSVGSQRKDKVDEVLLQLLRDGASMGCYLILSANRSNSIRINWMSSFTTKISLYLNDETELRDLMGREYVSPQAINGRGQVNLSVPTAIQFYLPAHGEKDGAILENLKRKVHELDRSWYGERPEKIPMVPDELTWKTFGDLVGKKEKNLFYLGLYKLSVLPATFPFYQGKTLGVFPESAKQFQLVMSSFMRQIFECQTKAEIILIDVAGTLGEMSEKVSVSITRTQIIQQEFELKEILNDVYKWINTQKKTVVIVNGLLELTEKSSLGLEEIRQFLTFSQKHRQLIVIDHLMKINGAFGSFINLLKEHIETILFGGDLQNQPFVEYIPYQRQKTPVAKDVLHCLNDDTLEQIVVPTEVDGRDT
ncbi:type VII secretion protein EssC [Candidatus Enterococcus wittei]|nr:type VII secretion protein EssC [Enterococcus sp. 10A9_DIV0425]